jgi:hypothetical protein
MGAAFDFLRRERVLAVEKSFSFEFQMKKDGEGAIGEENSESAATRAGATPCRAPVDIGLWSRRRQREPRGRAIARVSWCARTFVRRVCERS